MAKVYARVNRGLESDRAWRILEKEPDLRPAL